MYKRYGGYMAENINARTRLICLIEILTMYSDEKNIISIDEICEKLGEYGHEVSKRNVLADIKLINSTPMKIIGVNKPKKGFYLAKSYSQASLHLILEAIFSSDMLSEEDFDYIESYLRSNTCLPTLNLILDTTTSLNYALPKLDYSTDVLYNLRIAVRDHKQAKLEVLRSVPEKFFSDAKTVEQIIVNPIRIVVSNGFLALVCTRANSPKKAEFINLPRIKSADVLEEKASGFSGDIRAAVNYFDGSRSKASFVLADWLFIRFKTEYIELVENHFNTPVKFRIDEEDGYCIAKTFTAVTNELIGWLFALSDKIEVIAPTQLKNFMAEQAKKI